MNFALRIARRLPIRTLCQIGLAPLPINLIAGVAPNATPILVGLFVACLATLVATTPSAD